jgi:FSR family fosmidomycin resistance protein-like MFS transporter
MSYAVRLPATMAHAPAPAPALPPAIARPRTHLAVLLVLSLTHLLNDLIQALIPAVYPMLKDGYGLDFVQIGLITLTFQIAGSLLQPVVGWHTDSHPMPYSTVVGMTFTLGGLIGLAFASRYAFILASVAGIGIGSSIYHPEATRMARLASGSRQGLAQGLFQVGGYIGGALAPLLAALVIVPRGQQSLAWFSVLALLAMALMAWTASTHTAIRNHFTAARASLAGSVGGASPHSQATIVIGLTVLTVLMFSKNAYGESFRSFYTFYLIDRFGVSIQTSQMMLFLCLIAAAAGALLGGIVGDRIGRQRIIWISILGPLPFTLLLPYASFFWTGVLTVLINLVMASAFASILIYAMELIPNRIGLIGGLFYGLNFGLGGIAAAMLGGLADTIGIERVYQLCSFLPLVGLLAWFLPRIEEHRDVWPETASNA